MTEADDDHAVDVRGRAVRGVERLSRAAAIAISAVSETSSFGRSASARHHDLGIEHSVLGHHMALLDARTP